MSQSSRSLTLCLLLATILASDCTSEGAAPEITGEDTTTRSDTASDTGEAYIDYGVECAADCATATTASTCNRMSVKQSPDIWVGTYSCMWAEFTEMSKSGDECVSGETVGRCYCMFSYQDQVNEEGTEVYSVRGCGNVTGSPWYTEEDGRTYVALLTRSPVSGEDSNIAGCRYGYEGKGVPAACECLCSWQNDPTFECDYQQDVCLDTVNSLMWRAYRVKSWFDESAVANACADITTGGFTDWRVPTIDELRTLIRGCPQTESTGACGISSACADVSCAGAACGECVWAYRPSELAGTCALCASFSSGDCAMCAPGKGSGMGGCYLPLELAWKCGPYWSSTAATPVPDSTWGGYRWMLDFDAGAVEVSGSYYTETSDVTIVESASALIGCVRDP